MLISFSSVMLRPGFLPSCEGVFGGFGGDVGLRRGLMTATAVGSVTLVTGHAGYSKSDLDSGCQVLVRTAERGPRETKRRQNRLKLPVV